MKNKPGKNRKSRTIPKHAMDMVYRAKRMATERVFVYGSSVQLGVQLHGFESIYGLVPKQLGNYVMEEVKTGLISIPQTWRMWYGAFAEFENGDRKVYTALVDLHNILPRAIEEHISTNIMTLQDDVLKEGEPVMIGYGWIGTVSSTIDLEGSEEANIKFFEERDIYNKQLYLDTLAMAKLKEAIA